MENQTLANEGGGGAGLNYLRAHIHLRFRHAHHEIKDWPPSLGSRGGWGKKGAVVILNQLRCMSERLKKNPKC